jgi:pristinamycin I synthase-3/4
VLPRTRRRRSPASFGQRALWILDQFEGPSPRYNEPQALRLCGPLDAAALRQAWADVALRHESLRSLLHLEDDGVVQEVLPPAEALPRLAFEEAAVAPEDLAGALAEAARRPFGLGADLPARAFLFRIGPAEHVLLAVLHHTAFDGASIAPLWRDLATAYEARRTGAEPAWQALPVQYADFALWQLERFESDGAGGELRAFWAAELSGVPARSALPTDRPRRVPRRAAGGRVPVRVPDEVHAALRAAAASRRATVFTVVHAALAAVLRDRGAGDDVVVGTVVAGRGDPGLAGLVGFLANTVVLRVDAGTGSFGALLERARDAEHRAFAHQDLPFEAVVDLLQPQRALDCHPLVQVFLAFQVGSVVPPAIAGLTVSVEDVSTGTTQFDLCVDLVERLDAAGGAAGLEGWVAYATDVYDEATAEALRDDLVAALEAVAEGVDRVALR